MYKLLENIRAGRVSHGTMAKGGVNLVQHLASAGHDFMIVDMMHSNVDWTELSHMSWKARAEGLYPLVRLPANPWGSGASMPDRRFPVDAERAFGSGVEGLIWSIASVEEARIMAHMGRDSHQGTPVTTAQELEAKTAHSNNTRLLLPLIESIGALEALDDILAVDGISGVFIGCTDLAEVLGHPLGYLHPEVLAAVKKACTSAKARGKIVLANTGYAFPTIEGQISHAKALKECGVNMLMLQTLEFNVYMIAKAISDGVRAA